MFVLLLHLLIYQLCLYSIVNLFLDENNTEKKITNIIVCCIISCISFIISIIYLNKAMRIVFKLKDPYIRMTGFSYVGYESM